MSEENMKKVVEATEKAFQDANKKKQEEKIKAVVQELLEKIEDVKEEIKELSDKKKALEADLEFLKKGRLDLLKEHSEKSQLQYVPLQVYPIYIERVVEKQPVNPWYSSWQINCGGTSFIANATDVRNCVAGSYSIGTANGSTKTVCLF